MFWDLDRRIGIVCSTKSDVEETRREQNVMQCLHTPFKEALAFSGLDNDPLVTVTVIKPHSGLFPVSCPT